MADDVVLVANPAAGRNGGGSVLEAVRNSLSMAGRRVAVVHEASAAATLRAAERAVAAAGPGATLVAIGGDGLVHLLLPLAATADVTLAIVPSGTGNDIALALHIPADPLAAAQLVLTGAVTAMDAVRTGDRWWASVLCAGFDSAINERANAMRWPPGRRRYDLAIAAELARLHTEDFTVDVGGERWSGSATLVAVGNTGQYGGGYQMCAQADPADGLLDVTIVGPVGRVDLARMLSAVRKGTHLGHPAVTTLRGREVRLAAAGVSAYADGERLGDLPLTATCRAAALRVIVPAGGPPYPG